MLNSSHLPCRSTLTSWAFHSWRPPRRTQRTSSRPSWPWPRRSRTGSDPRHPRAPRGKSRSSQPRFSRRAAPAVAKSFRRGRKKMFVYHLEDVLKGFALNKITRKMKKSGNDVISRWSNATTTTRNVLKEKKHLKPRSSSSHPYFQNRHRVKRNSRFLSP